MRSNGSVLWQRRLASSLSANGVWDLREHQLYRRSLMWPTTGDLFWINVSLLLRMDGTNGSTTFVDSSSNNFTVTCFGNTQISTSVKQFGTGSGYFDGNGDYLQIAHNSILDLGAGDFTIEAWVYFTTINSTTFQTIVGKWLTGAFGYILQLKSDTFSLAVGNNGGFANAFSASTTFVINTWYHVAASRSGSSIRFFVNGQQVGSTFSNSSNLSASPSLQIGRNADGDQQYFNGYIDELRLTKGVSRYTSNFTAPTAAFPEL